MRIQVRLQEREIEFLDLDSFVHLFEVGLYQNSQRIGVLSATRVDCLEAELNSFPLFEIFDNFSQLLLEIYMLVFTPDDEVRDELFDDFDISSVRTLIYIDACVLHPKYRRKGMGLWLMRKSISLIGGDLVICEPHPIMHSTTLCPSSWLENYEDLSGKGAERLKAYWSRIGFQPLSDSKYFAVNTDSASFSSLRDIADEFPQLITV